MTELEALEAGQDALTAAKKAMRDFSAAMKAMVDINHDHPEEANVVRGAKARGRIILGEIELMHSDATRDLFKYWPDHAEPIVTRAGHR